MVADRVAVLSTGVVDPLACACSAVVVGDRRDVYPLRRASAAWPVELVRTDLDQRRRVPVIRSVEHDHIAGSCMRAREPQRQLVGLAAGVDEVADGQRLRQRRAQPLREVPDRVVQVSRVGVQRAHLIHRGLHDPWMRVPDMRNVVVGVKVLRAAVVEQVLHPAAGELHRVGVRETEIRAEPPLPLRQGGCTSAPACHPVLTAVPQAARKASSAASG